MKFYYLLLSLSFILSACDHGFAPPEPSFGTIEAHITFVGTKPDNIDQLIFAAARFKPILITDIVTRFNEIALSGNLKERLAATPNTLVVRLENIPTGLYAYSAVAFTQTGEALTNARIVSPYRTGDGSILLTSNQTVRIDLTANFDQMCAPLTICN